jgi:hypothetical protein
MIICKFMEELCDKHQTARENSLPTDFKIKDFYNIGLSNKYLSRIGLRTSSVGIRVLVLDTLIEYVEKKGFLEIEGNTVRLTSKGLIETSKLLRDWD